MEVRWAEKEANKENTPESVTAVDNAQPRMIFLLIADEINVFWTEMYVLAFG